MCLLLTELLLLLLLLENNLSFKRIHHLSRLNIEKNERNYFKFKKISHFVFLTEQ